MAITATSRYATLTAAPGGAVPFRRAGSAYVAPAAEPHPLDVLGSELTARFDVTAHGKPTGATIGRDYGRPAARRAGFRTPPR